MGHYNAKIGEGNFGLCERNEHGLRFPLNPVSKIQRCWFIGNAYQSRDDHAFEFLIRIIQTCVFSVLNV